MGVYTEWFTLSIIVLDDDDLVQLVEEIQEEFPPTYEFPTLLDKYFKELVF